MENVIYAKYLIGEENFDNLLDKCFDENGNCLIEGAEKTKDEIQKEINSMPLDNHTLSIPIKMNVEYLDEDEINTIITTGKLRREGCMTIFLDLKHYGLKNHMELTNPFIDKEELEKAKIEDVKKREELVSELLKCKKGFENKVR